MPSPSGQRTARAVSQHMSEPEGVPKSWWQRMRDSWRDRSIRAARMEQGMQGSRTHPGQEELDRVRRQDFTPPY